MYRRWQALKRTDVNNAPIRVEEHRQQCSSTRNGCQQCSSKETTCHGMYRRWQALKRTDVNNAPQTRNGCQQCSSNAERCQQCSYTRRGASSTMLLYAERMSTMLFKRNNVSWNV